MTQRSRTYRYLRRDKKEEKKKKAFRSKSVQYTHAISSLQKVVLQLCVIAVRMFTREICFAITEIR